MREHDFVHGVTNVGTAIIIVHYEGTMIRIG